MNLPRSTYYHKPKNRTGDDWKLIKRIEEIIVEFPGYGYRRVTHELHRRDVAVNHKKVLRIMRQQRLTRKPKRRWIRTTNSNHCCRVYPNLLKNLAVTGPNQVWVADITYIAIQAAFVYLAVILDLFARKAIGYAISRFIDTALCLETLGMAIQMRKPPKGVIHHSDQGVQYASHDYVGTLLSHGFRISMARRGNPYDNAAAESFIKTLKTEEVHLWEYRTITDVHNRLPYFIEEVYNRKRLHSALGYRPPVEFEKLFYETLPCPATLISSV
jgi:putative transposase